MIYTTADVDSLHVDAGSRAYKIGDGPASESYLNIDKLLNLAKENDLDAVHPGYGFLSENAGFVRSCEKAGIRFIGPSVSSIESFGLKHKARAMAVEANVPLLPGTGVIANLEEAVITGEKIGYPLMLKSSAGGGGIGMQTCHSETELRKAWESTISMSEKAFGRSELFLEKRVVKARHIEVQAFGDGKGKVLILGDRDCSLQRRNQKVVEECPAVGLSDTQRQSLHESARRLLAQQKYRSAGTVEFVYDEVAKAFYFLEVNTRLQVEHTITEEVWGVDLVDWMILLEEDRFAEIEEQFRRLKPQGHSFQLRVYAEDPLKNYQPTGGKLTRVDWSTLKDWRIESFVHSGIELSSFYDPMIAKLIVQADSREAVLKKIKNDLSIDLLVGTETNLEQLYSLFQANVFESLVTTSSLNEFEYDSQKIEVLNAGLFTTVQDFPGRSGYWKVGVPPSGPMDDFSLRIANRVLGNSENAPGLEMTMTGVSLKFHSKTRVCVLASEMEVLVNEKPQNLLEAILIPKNGVLSLGKIQEGQRAYLAFEGGLQVANYLGSASCFTLGGFGGHAGRALALGDSLRTRLVHKPKNPIDFRLETYRDLTKHKVWSVGVLFGPQGHPEFFTPDGIEQFFNFDWEVHFNSDRTGVRLIGPKPNWARQDGGEAGLHPSNIHDNAYALGSVDFTGDMPVLLGPDGPSLGGFVCPAVILESERWKMGQLRAGDKLRFVPLSFDVALDLRREKEKALESGILNEYLAKQKLLETSASKPLVSLDDLENPVLLTSEVSKHSPGMRIRQAGDACVLIEYGEMKLDMLLRMRVQQLFEHFDLKSIPGIRDLTPGIRSLQIHFDPLNLERKELLALIVKADEQLTPVNQAKVKSRIVHLPLSWDDPQTRLAIEKYLTTVRANAPWGPSNIEFIRRINGLDSIQDVMDIVYKANYLVMGLGDVYLGAPVATPTDPRHRLVTTKYNPARTWTPENAVGIGGAYLCIYGMEGPGGYQFVGRTLQVWNKLRSTREFNKDRPWLLRFFDQIRFYPVTTDELSDYREQFLRGRHQIKIEESVFDMSEYLSFLEKEKESIISFQQKQQKAFLEEREMWKREGLDNFQAKESIVDKNVIEEIPKGCLAIESPFAASVWKSYIKEGYACEKGQDLFTLEAMKVEHAIFAPESGTVQTVLVKEGDVVQAGQVLAIVKVLRA